VIEKVNKEYLSELSDTATVQADIVQYVGNAAELDEQWSFVSRKSNQRWLWLAIEHESRVVLAFAFGRRTDEVFSELKSLLTPYGITTFYTDAWGAYDRNLPAANHVVGKSDTQRIERKNLTLRTRVKRLARRTICFSKSELLHDIVIGLFINFFEFSYFHILLNKLF
jgi:IS1 family transposase